jgi:ribosomal protein L29
MNYEVVDSSIIPHLKKLTSDYKIARKKYKRCKKIFEDQSAALEQMKVDLRRLEHQARNRNQYKSVKREDDGYTDRQSLERLSSEIHLTNMLKNVEKETESVKLKIKLLQEFKEQTEVELRQSVDELKHELFAVREELKSLKKEKYWISDKLKGIEDRYKEAKDSFKNAEEVLTYTNRMLINQNNSMRASLGSEWSRYLKTQESKIESKTNIDFYNFEEPQQKEEKEDNQAHEIFSR